MAQDFYNLFKLGTDDKTISSIDPAGIALAGIQAQQKLISDQKEKIASMEKILEAMNNKLNDLNSRITELEKKK
jgi:hypothetical protein